MNLIDKLIELPSKASVARFYVLGDTHIGALNCAEGHLRRFVRYVAKQKNAWWIGGGDYCDCITRNDLKRFDLRQVPDWMLQGDGETIRERLTDIARAERKRFLEIVAPINDRCLGLIEGNHESEYEKRTDTAMQLRLCEALHTPDLTDCAFIRLRFGLTNRSAARTTIVFYVAHGWGGGRSAGAEDRKLAELASFVEGAHVILRGHAHRFDPGEPKVVLYIPHRGRLPYECYSRTVRTANWGCWLKSYARGKGTYDSQRNYAPRPLLGLEIKVKPFSEQRKSKQGADAAYGVPAPTITVSECPYLDM